MVFIHAHIVESNNKIEIYQNFTGIIQQYLRNLERINLFKISSSYFSIEYVSCRSILFDKLFIFIGIY